MGQNTSQANRTLFGEEYERGRTLAISSYGRVYSYRHKISQKFKVVKELHKDLLIEAKVVDRTLQVRKILSLLQDCPFVPRLYAAVQDPQSLQLLMGYYGAHDLGIQLKLHHKFDEEAVKHLLAHLVIGLEDIHQFGIMHRDLKPENILLDSEGFAYISDFFMAYTNEDLSQLLELKAPTHPEQKRNRKSFSETSGKTLSHTPEVTPLPVPEPERPRKPIRDENTGKQILGTLPYISPELLAGRPHDEKVDWWCLGIIGYLLAHGEVPWPMPPKSSSNPYQKYYDEIHNREPIFASNLSAEYKDLIKGLLTINPTKRFGLTQVKDHHFFHKLNWDLIRLRKIKPPFHPKSDMSSPGKKYSEIHTARRTLTTDEQKQFSGWDWVNPQFPAGLTPEEEDIIFFKSFQDYPQGLQLYQHELSSIRGKVLFSLKEMPEHVLFCTERGSNIEKISPLAILVGDVEIAIVLDYK